MTFEEYQRESWKTAIYPNKRDNFVYPTLGLTGEAGEVAEKVKKVIRDDDGIMYPSKRAEIAKELGDVLWYVAALCTELKLDMGLVALSNVQKLNSRMKRDQIHGNGDNR